jgi:lipoprotein-anchoring transpeptidase ErfK/SrfK
VAQTPTPGGLYYIKELLKPPNPNTVYGPYAYGLSGFSDALESFEGGDAVIGIHGTNDPSGLGKDVSHGCIRMPNDQIIKLVEEIKLPLGVPVEIRP